MPSTSRTMLALGAILAGLAVVAGAFGAHGLEGRVTPVRLDAFKTAAQYQMYHALALLGIGLLTQRLTHRALTWASWCFVGGVVVFSGSLYVLVLTDTAWLGAITPLGGTAMIAGWGFLVLGILRGRGAES
ncbi:MAG: DUF423 domain-containing protein [Bacteroidota bacterium]